MHPWGGEGRARAAFAAKGECRGAQSLCPPEAPPDLFILLFS